MDDARNREREAILTAAAKLLFRLGAAGFTMDRLARELRMSKKTLYRHFESRNALLIALLDVIGERVDRETQAVLADRTLDSAAKLERLVNVFGRHLSTLDASRIEVFRRDPVLWNHATSVRQDRIIAPIRRVLEEAVERGEVRPEVRPEMVTHFVPVLVELLAQSEAVVESSVSVGEVLEQFGTILTRGMFRPGDGG